MIDLEVPGYQINAKRAEHRLGTVYDAVQVAEARDVELLILHSSLTQVPGLEERFLDAAREATRLSSVMRGIVAPVDAASLGDALYLARAASEGYGLDDYMAGLQRRKAQMPLDTLRKTLLAIALRLGALHDRGIVHGNLTAAALNASRDSGLLLTDLGLPNLNAKEAVDLREGASQIVPYMSPEQMLDRGESAATDIFAFGVVAYYLATGRLPRSGSLWKQGLKAYWAHVPQQAHDLRPEIEPPLGALIHKSLSIQPQHRHSSAAELTDDLQKVILNISQAPAQPAPHQASAADTPAGDVSGKQQDAAMPVVEMEPQSIRQGQSVSLTLYNGSNETLMLSVRGEDPNESLRFEGELDEVALEPGVRRTVDLRVRAREQPLVGRVRNVPFFVTIVNQEGVSEKLEGTVTVEPVVPVWASGILLFGLLALCAGGGFWLWSPFAGEPAALTGQTPQTMVAVSAATTSATATATTGASATPVVDVTTALTASATATPTASVTATATASATASPTATATDQDTTLTPAATETPEQTSAPAEEIALQVQFGDRNEIWVVTTGNREPRLLVADAGQPAWSPDGSHLAFTRPASSGTPQAELLFVTPASGMGVRSISEDAMQIGGLTWSPDGSQIAFHAAPADAAGTSEYQIFIAQSDGSGVRQLTTGADGFANMWPVWSPVDTGLLAYGLPQSGTGGAQLRLYNTQNQNMDVLYTEDETRLAAGEYDWSPDGEQLVFSLSSETGDSQLFIRDANVPMTTPVTSGLVAAGSPTWSPDGQQIAFVASGSDDREAAVIAGAGGDDEQNIVSAWDIEELFWSPDGDRLGVAGDFEGDGLVQLWIFEISGAESVALIEDLSVLPSSETGDLPPTIVAAVWRPHAP